MGKKGPVRCTVGNLIGNIQSSNLKSIYPDYVQAVVWAIKPENYSSNGCFQVKFIKLNFTLKGSEICRHTLGKIYDPMSHNCSLVCKIQAYGQKTHCLYDL